MTSVVGSDDYFPTQATSESKCATISDQDRALGAPFDPVPKAFLAVPEWMRPCAELPSSEEISAAESNRSIFSLPGQSAPYMTDIIRAFRLVKEVKTYLEVGIFDRGNLAFASTLLAEDAILIGVDIQPEPDRDELLRSVLKPSQKYLSIIGDRAVNNRR